MPVIPPNSISVPAAASNSSLRSSRPYDLLLGALPLLFAANLFLWNVFFPEARRGHADFRQGDLFHFQDGLCQPAKAAPVDAHGALPVGDGDGKDFGIGNSDFGFSGRHAWVLWTQVAEVWSLVHTTEKGAGNNPHFSPTGYGAENAFVAELARVPTNPFNALNSGEFSYGLWEMRARRAHRGLAAR